MVVKADEIPVGALLLFQGNPRSFPEKCKQQPANTADRFSQSEVTASDRLHIDDPIMSIKECAELLHCHEVTLSLWAKEDRGPPRLSPQGVRKILYSKRQVLDWLQQRADSDPLPPDPP